MKEVDPKANALLRGYGRMSIEEQARSLARLGERGADFFYESGRIVTRDVGKFEGTFWELLKTKIAASWRLRTPFNDVYRHNIGRGGIIFDPALTAPQRLLWWIATWSAEQLAKMMERFL